MKVSAPKAVLRARVKETPPGVWPAASPIAVLLLPMVLKGREPAPTATLPVPVVVPRFAAQPTATFELPAVLDRSAL